MIYEDTVPMTREEFDASSEAIGRIQAKFDEKKLKEESTQIPLRHSKRKRNIIESDDEENIDLEALLENSDNNNKKAKTDTPTKSVTSDQPAKKMDNNLQKPDTKECSVYLESLDSILKRELKQSV